MLKITAVLDQPDGRDVSKLLMCSVGPGQFRSWEKEYVFEHEPPPRIKEKARLDTLLVHSR